MQSSIQFFLLSTLALLSTSVKAQATVYLAGIVLLDPTGLSTSQIDSVTNALDDLETTFTTDITSLAEAMEAELEPDDDDRRRQLRVSRELRTCNPCTGWPPGKMCYWYGKWRPACRRAEQEVPSRVFEALDEEALAQLEPHQRRRHLQIASACSQALSDLTSALDQAVSDNVITAPRASMEEHCVYDIIGEY